MEIGQAIIPGMSVEISRRDFIRNVLQWGSGVILAGALSPLVACARDKEASSVAPLAAADGDNTAGNRVAMPPPGATYLAVARGEDTTAIVDAALKAMGGIGRFVKKGDRVIIKPNICVAYHTYEYAATTNPEVVAALVRLCLGAGAGSVLVMDQPFGGSASQAYERSGIARAVKEAGGEMHLMNPAGFKETSLPDGRDIRTWPIYTQALEADVLINVPIAKHHSLARLTLGMKNLMGLIKDRSQFHFNLGQRIADLTSRLRPQLTVIDAVRILTDHGPTGGSLDDVRVMNTVIASHDVVAADAYAATLFGLSGDDIPAVRAAVAMGLGVADLKNIKIEEIQL